VALVLLAADHHGAALPDIERLSVGAETLPLAVTGPGGADGAVVLATCNRVELYLDTPDPAATLDLARSALAEASGVDGAEVEHLTGSLVGDEVVQHLFEVACGLDAMIVGEREIVGQVRRSLEHARAAGTTTPVLEDVVQRASRASRKVAVDTDLAAAGRSVVAVALDLAAARGACHDCLRTESNWFGLGGPLDLPRSSWAGKRVVVVGTGAYAGATVAALRRRECRDIAVWSTSGRAAGFAAAEGVRAAGDLGEEIAVADLVVTCRGTGTVVVDADTVRAAVRARRERGVTDPVVIIDLALRKDVAEDVAAEPGVVVIDLETVQAHAPAATDGQVQRAQEIVAEEVRAVVDRHAERQMDQVVVAVRSRIGVALEEELARLPMAGPIPAEDAARALRRLASRLAHGPTVAARAAGRQGRGDEFIHALDMVAGIDASAPARVPVAATLEPGAAAVGADVPTHHTQKDHP
jgi:glutamyl-tRNA reductase